MASADCRFMISDCRLNQTSYSPIINHQSSIINSLTWLPAGLLATLLMLVASLSAFGAEPRNSELKWQRPTTTSTSSRIANRLRDHAARSTSPQSLAPSPSPNRLRDRSVRPVAHEEVSGPVLRVADEGAPRFQSIVTPPEKAAPRSAYVAQQPVGQAPNGLEREIERPFELPPMEEPAPMPEPIPEPDVEPMPLPTDPTLQQPIEQPLAPPFTQPPGPGVQPDPFDRNQEEPRLPDPAPEGPTSLSKEQQEAEENCQDELDKLRANTLEKISLQIGITGTPGEDFPMECTVDDGSPFAPRCWSEVTYMWKASALCHKPLYFECEQMERYGHSWGPVADPLIAGAHFFTRLPVLPYCMGITPPNECIYAIGHYRPGSCAPYMIDPIPFTWRAAANQTAFTVGMVYFLPAGVSAPVTPVVP